MHHLAARWLSILVPVLPVAALAIEPAVITESALATQARQHGPTARKRLSAWRDILVNPKYKAWSERAKLRLVNDFMNKTPFVEDIVHWKQEDYWATPIEFLSTNGGDCEDFAIAKYFTLRALGIADANLGITYVIRKRTNKAHMVLAYFPAPGSEPLILDNERRTIQPASRRTDLVPVYRFNASGIWLATGQTGFAQPVGSSDRISRWRQLKDRVRGAM